MELSLATVDQIADELRKRSLGFVLVVSPDVDDNAPDDEIEPEYRIYSSSSESSNEQSLQDVVHCLVGAVTVISELGEELEDLENPSFQDFLRWKGAAETLVRDIFATAQGWSDEYDEEDEEED